MKNRLTGIFSLPIVFLGLLLLISCEEETELLHDTSILDPKIQEAKDYF